MVPPTAVALAGGLAAAALFAVNNVLKCIIKNNDAEEHRGKEGEAGRQGRRGGIAGIVASAKRSEQFPGR